MLESTPRPQDTREISDIEAKKEDISPKEPDDDYEDPLVPAFRPTDDVSDIEDPEDGRRRAGHPHPLLPIEVGNRGDFGQL